MLELLDEANAVEVRFTGDGATGTVVPSRLEPLILTDATREGFFDPEASARAMRMLGNVAARRVLVHDLLLPALLSDAPEVPRALVRRIENLRREVPSGRGRAEGPPPPWTVSFWECAPGDV